MVRTAYSLRCSLMILMDFCSRTWMHLRWVIMNFLFCTVLP